MDKTTEGILAAVAFVLSVLFLPLTVVVVVFFVLGFWGVMSSMTEFRRGMQQRPDDMRRVGDDLREPGNPAHRAMGLAGWMRGGRGG